MPQATPFAAAAAAVSRSAAWTAGAFTFPRWPMEADRSPGPTKIASTPSTAMISSRAAIASGVSSCTTTPISAPAPAR